MLSQHLSFDLDVLCLIAHLATPRAYEKKRRRHKTEITTTTQDRENDDKRDNEREKRGEESRGSEEETGDRKEGSDENYVSLKQERCSIGKSAFNTENSKILRIPFLKKTELLYETPSPSFGGIFFKKTRPFQV